MLRRFLAPLHPDGFKFVAAGVVATLLLFWLWAPAGWTAAVATLWIAYFFRDPWRVTPTRPGLLISPADGIVVSIAAATPPQELAMGDAAVVRIGIFLNILDVHVTRAPAGGRVAAMRYTKGRFVNASLDKASEGNERLAIRIAQPEGPDIAFGWSPGSSRGASSVISMTGSRLRAASGSASSALARGSTFIARRLMSRWLWRGSA